MRVLPEKLVPSCAVFGLYIRAAVSGSKLRLDSCGVSVPGLRFVDAASGALGIEWIDGKSVRSLLGSGDEGEETEVDEDEDFLAEYGVPKGINFSHLSSLGR